ncbi:hypothetical protein JCM8097_000544 [Rhodosporidiobolus ruineniae]
MDKIKQVFSKDEHKSPSGHFTTESSDEAHRTSTDDRSTTTPSYSSAGDRSVTDSATTPSHSSSGDRSATKAAAETAAAAATTHNSASSGPTTSTSTTGARTEGKLERAAEHFHEHAHPPAHKHNQPVRDGILSEADAKAATHDHQHLAPVTHETHYHHEIEEIERQREVDRHVHHIQLHEQPVLDTQHAAEQHRQKVVPVTEIKEAHVATEEDKAQFAALNTAKDQFVEAPKEKVIIDKGEQVVENVSHAVHHIVQPVIERDTHEHHRIHTVIPIHATVHEAPIVHSSVQHEPMSLKDFTAGGGDLSSKLKHDANLLVNKHNADCQRTVDGPAETLVEQLGLTSLNDKTTTSAAPTATSASTTSTAAGTTGGAVSTANQDPLLGYVPLVGIDMWEHAFYLDYKNVKQSYLDAIWGVINWSEAEKRLASA